LFKVNLEQTVDETPLTSDEEFEIRSSSDLLVRIASLYYLNNETQESIAARLGLSRQKVQRYLKKAHDEGIVEIRIHPSSAETNDLAEEIRDRFQLRDVLVAPAHPNPHAQRKAVAQEAAQFMEGFLKGGMVVAVGMGRNTGEVPNYFNPSKAIDCTFVAAMGGSPKVDLRINPNEICRSLAEKSGGKAEILYAPAFVESSEMRSLLVQQETIRNTLDLAKRADVALVGIGGTDDACVLVKSGSFSVYQVRQLRNDMAVGDLLGNYFDIYGNLISSDLYGRLIGLTIKDLERTETVIALVSESNKTTSILGALRTGIVDILIVDASNARGVLSLADAYPL
jgi:DNA-binding transcriptional regulator LsrR (DeoR family)